MASATPDLQLPSQPQGITAHWLLPNYTAWWQRHMCVNNLPRVALNSGAAGIWTRDLPISSAPYRHATEPHNSDIGLWKITDTFKRVCTRGWCSGVWPCAKRNVLTAVLELSVSVRYAGHRQRLTHISTLVGVSFTDDLNMISINELFIRLVNWMFRIKNSSKRNQLFLHCWRFGLCQRRKRQQRKNNCLCFDEFLIWP